MDLVEARNIINRIDHLGQPIPFSIEFFTANVSKQTGGELIKLDFAVKNFNFKRKFVNKVKPTVSVSDKPLTDRQESHSDNQTTVIAILAKDRNGKLVPTGEIKTIHYRLLHKLNDELVQW